ncbi:MAG TPA: DUF58 domain-containing protein [Bacteroidales bacterium]|nr:DUF58 domain-containing protein [Bacteroidales bacterium]HOL75292.1 DUF58 domain-containing protein [Bacteroidales bacterium]HPZ37052.1 DUF58 domain-containing protein [Bacteroidales bacterium]HQD35352.1 DUF58 domain-containing protein [Bacteroidales bacterium]
MSIKVEDLRKKVRHISITARKLSNQMFAGQYQSAFKGKGMAYSDLREYVYGDDIRDIEWNVTARHNHPYIKVYQEERELTLIFMIDVSRSTIFGSTAKMKNELISEIAGILAFSALKNNDRIGVILFSDIIEKFIPPKKGLSHILAIIREILAYEPKSSKTNIKNALEYLNHVIPKRSIVFLISDFYDTQYELAMGITNRKHDFICIQIVDNIEITPPDNGFVITYDPESDKFFPVDLRDKKFQKAWMDVYQVHHNYLEKTCKKHNIDFLTIDTQIDYIPLLTALFKKREKRLV